MAPIIALLLVTIAVCTFGGPVGPNKEKTPNWNYRSSESWHKSFPTCGGRSQSPVDISTHLESFHEVEPFVFVRYNVTPSDIVVKNNGHTVVASWITDDPDTLPGIRGGGLSCDYVFSNAHFHWGSTNTRGTEHTLDGKSGQLEVHLVHYKREYGTLKKALKYDDGLAVLGAIFITSPMANNRLFPLIDALKDVVMPGSKINPVEPFPLDALLPERKGSLLFYRYNGSLTTPPCNEVVIWTLFQDLVKISEEQLDEFRSLKCSDGIRSLQNNFRPVQPLNGREVMSLKADVIDTEL